MSLVTRVMVCALLSTIASPLLAQQADDPLGSSPPDGAESARPAPSNSSAGLDAEARIEAVLAQPLTAPLEFPETALNQVLEFLSEDYGIPIVIDSAAFDTLAISPDTDVNIHIRHTTLDSALKLMLRSPALEGIVHVIDHEVLLLTSRDVANSTLKPRVYRVDDLIRDRRTGELDFDSLISLIIYSVAVDSWQENGTGEGAIQPLTPGILVISQTRPVHAQITKLLAEIRNAKNAIDKEAVADTTPDDSLPVTRAIRIQNIWGENPKSAFHVVQEAILRSVDWDGIDSADGDEPYLAVLPDRVVVRHLPSVVERVEDVLRDLDLLKPGAVPIGFGGPGGGR
ncbi:hypothetical protein OAS39_08935 [Pirellulales bacterium]|nr:hypothetical protein [Pirellulales bacterium]